MAEGKGYVPKQALSFQVFDDFCFLSRSVPAIWSIPLSNTAYSRSFAKISGFAGCAGSSQVRSQPPPVPPLTFSGAFRTFGPKLFDDYVTDLQALFDHHPGLQHNFTNSIYPAVTYNLGPQSVTFDHVDDLNRPLGWCAVTNAVPNDGGFDHQKSAHLYLKQLKLVIEFPPAATSLFPSAVINHGNTPLSPNETRYSITQYAAGGLFRWVKYGFRTAKQVLAQGGRTLKDALDGAPGKRLNDGLDLFSTVDGLATDHAACFRK
jgi:hypothetical protein